MEEPKPGWCQDVESVPWQNWFNEADFFEDKTNQRERRGRHPATFHLQWCICQFTYFFVFVSTHATNNKHNKQKTKWLKKYMIICFANQPLSTLVHLSIYFFLCRLRQELFTKSWCIYQFTSFFVGSDRSSLRSLGAFVNLLHSLSAPTGAFYEILVHLSIYFILCQLRQELFTKSWCICEFTSFFVGSDRSSLPSQAPQERVLAWLESKWAREPNCAPPTHFFITFHWAHATVLQQLHWIAMTTQNDSHNEHSLYNSCNTQSKAADNEERRDNM